MTNPQRKPRPYNTLPRFIAEDYLDKKLTRSEFILCLWLRAIADPYGVTTTSAAAIRDDMFPKVEVNTVEKLLLSLRKKKYVHFQNHQGRRGSVRIESDEWLIKGKGIKRIADKIVQEEDTSAASIAEEVNAEPGHKFIGQNHNFAEQKRQVKTRFDTGSKYDRFTSDHNEHDIEQEKENNTSASFKGTLTRDFIPSNGEEQRCREIAMELGEEHINALLKVLRLTKGSWSIEKAWEVYENDRTNGKQISNPGAYFQGVIKKIRANL